MTTAEETATQPVRVNLVFNDRAVRVPYGVTLFDAASWNGIAIDSTCGGHGTCKKCRIRIAEDPPAPQMEIWSAVAALPPNRAKRSGRIKLGSKPPNSATGGSVTTPGDTAR